jgi:hypothetical protein
MKEFLLDYFPYLIAGLSAAYLIAIPFALRWLDQAP